jgi:HAMP domain-containing protein
MEPWIVGIVAAAITALTGVIWAMLQRRVDEVAASQHEVAANMAAVRVQIESLRADIAGRYVTRDECARRHQE